MKWSRYNNFIEKNNDDDYILFNCSTNNYIYLKKEVKELLVDTMYDVSRIESIQPELYNSLKKNEFIINDRFDELKDAINRIQNNPNYSDYFELIINPTLDCNLRCWYCYESHPKKSAINKDTLKSIMLFIKNKAETQALIEILISFFGGEPLLEFNEVIWPLIEYSKKICAENRKKLRICFNTNAVLLTSKIVDQLYTSDLCCTFQVPFDGNEIFHNKTKKYANGKGTFEKIIHNVMYALSFGNKFIIRCNYTAENLHSFDELISIFTEYASECMDLGQIIFAYHRVWQVKETTEMNPAINKFKEKTNLTDLTFDTCYADRTNSVVINYNGDVYKCTARDFKPENREGYLNEDGRIIYNEKYNTRMDIRFSNKHCQNCSIFPICNVCTQIRLDSQNENPQCLRFASEEEKKRILLKKIGLLTNNKLN